MCLVVFSNIPLNTCLAEKKKKMLTTKFNEVNVRNGPGLNHLKKFKILKKGYPLKIIDNFDNWKKVVDVNGNSGWVSNSQLSNNRYVIINSSEAYIYKFPLQNSKKIALVKGKKVLALNKCNQNWCQINDNKINGWVMKKEIWGYEE